MRLHFLGVRGSTAAPGAPFVRYGGHTSCVAVSRQDARIELVLDAGTGIRTLSSMLDGLSFRGSIVLTHLHWDHMQGIPFFTAGDRPDSHVNVYLPAQAGRSGSTLLAQAMSPPSFPISPQGLLGEWTFHAIDPGSHRIESFDVIAGEVPHKGGRTFGYRISDEAASLAYVPDHVAAGSDHGLLAPLVRDVDVLIHDAQFLEPERKLAQAYGHSTVQDAIELAATMGVKHLVLFHHSPVRTDDQLDAIAESVSDLVRATGAKLRVTVASEGQTLEV